MRRALLPMPLFAVLAVLALAAAAWADSPKTVLVLDGSGSMWAKVGERHKIEIARDVMARVLAETPEERQLGLVAYGHNRKGDCADIEELAPVGASRDEIRRAVDALNPQGKTPLSDAVIFAAESLRYREEAATVVLISDGIETCDADPCAVGKALEESGVDFTVHVVGFDIAEPGARAQLACLAENTGGVFISASNADELTIALQETVAAPPPPPAPEAPKTGKLALRATELEGGPEIVAGLVWRVAQAGGGAEMFVSEEGGAATAELPPGVYDVFVTRIDSGQSGVAEKVEMRAGAERTVTIALDIALTASLRLEPADTAPVNSEILVYWEGPDRQGDYVTIVPKGAKDTEYRTYEYTRNGQPLTLRTVAEPGEYEVRYMLSRPAKALARASITLTDALASLDAPEQVGAGAEFEVAWKGPGERGDWITVVPPDAGPKQYQSYAYPRENPVRLKAAIEPGSYEIRYVLAGERVIARRAIEVAAVSATVSGPVEIGAGDTFDVAWTGPAERGDWVTIVAEGAAAGAYTSYFYPVSTTSPGQLKAPLAPGSYELRYVQAGKKVLASAPISVIAQGASLRAPAEGAVGETIAVEWTGPNSKGDYVGILDGSEKLRDGGSYFYTANGSPGELILPVAPGAYEIVYFQGGKKELARAAIEVEDAAATLDAPTSVIAGASIPVGWTGPNAKGDWVTIVAPGEGPRKAGDYFYTANGSPGELNAPLDPGAYELRYVLRGRRVLERVAITVEPATASFDAPATVAAEQPVEIGWTGPGGRRDLVTIAEPSQKPHHYVSYKYARNGAPATLTAPKTPGVYEIRYVLDGKKIIARQSLTVSPGG